MFVNRNKVLFLILAFSFASCTSPVSISPVNIEPAVQESAKLNSVSASVSSTDTSKVISIEISQKNITLAINQQLTINAVVKIESGELNSAVEWISSDNSVVSVNASGELNALKRGSVVVKAISIQDSNISAECIVNVVDTESDKPSSVEVKSVSGRNELIENQTLKLNGLVRYVNGQVNSDLVWKSSDESIAKVSSDGLVSGYKKGMVTIFVFSRKDIAVKSDFIINVIEKTVKTTPTPIPTKTPTPTATPTSTPVPSSTPTATPSSVPMPNDLVWAINGEIYAIGLDGTKVNLTNSSANDDYASFSPDKSRIVFHSNKDGPLDIYTMKADGSALQKVAQGWHPSWSPDGSKIIFISKESDGAKSAIYSVNTDGTGLKLIFMDSNNSITPSWSPDGSKIIFSSDYIPNAGDCNGWDIRMINADGSSPKVLTNTNPCTGESVGVVSFSPDATKMVFWSSRDSNLEIYAMNTDGSAQTNLTQNPAHDAGSIWLADGRIVFATNRDGKDSLYIMNADGKNQTKLIDF